jgi:hypothetical protein
MSGREFFTTPEQLAGACRALGLPEGTPRLVVEAELKLRYGLADRLISDVERVLSTEFEYLELCAAFDWQPGD